ncbi:MAG TPA: Rrf2 family transcriptional regulator [Noviherbaspirillum sp.]|jgi:DNA-binding IscR family transcriptional regulator|uniref:Rrf2 family transcriptional regulator n=1 Tax=Noviherbaspirillum sp. TaxID=1926288 RepID=UPI002F955ACF
MTHDYLLGNAALHERFFATTEILAKMVTRAPRAISITQLEAETGRPARELGKLCHALGRAGIVRQDEQAADKWAVVGDPSQVTLEDVFRCILEQQSPTRAEGRTERAASDVDLVVMQAMIAINQSVFTQLRRFSLDRVKASAGGSFPTHRRQPVRRFDEELDTPLSGREAVLDSPVHLAA